MPETVVILGRGVGGLVAAELRKALLKKVRIVLVERASCSRRRSSG
jgi:NADH dehydrogenase FAD-containing subunit